MCYLRAGDRQFQRIPVGSRSVFSQRSFSLLELLGWPGPYSCFAKVLMMVMWLINTRKQLSQYCLLLHAECTLSTEKVFGTRNLHFKICAGIETCIWKPGGDLAQTRHLYICENELSEVSVLRSGGSVRVLPWMWRRQGFISISFFLFCFVYLPCVTALGKSKLITALYSAILGEASCGFSHSLSQSVKPIVFCY